MAFQKYAAIFLSIRKKTGFGNCFVVYFHTEISYNIEPLTYCHTVLIDVHHIHVIYLNMSQQPRFTGDEHLLNYNIKYDKTVNATHVHVYTQVFTFLFIILIPINSYK